MDAKTNIETIENGDIKPGRNWKDSKLIFIVLPIILTVLFPLGGLPYLCGRFSPYAITLAHVYVLYLGTICFIIFCFVVGVGKLFGVWNKRSKSGKFFISAQMMIPLGFLVLLFSSFFLPESEFSRGSHKFFMRGFRERVRSKADIESIRDWLEMLSKDDYNSSHYNPIPPSKHPKLLKVLKPVRVGLLADKNSNPKVRLMWGSGFMGHWGVDIGMADMEIPKADVSEWTYCWLLVEPGVYIWESD